MSVVIERFLICDAPRCDENYGVDNRQDSIERHRFYAHREGWTTHGSKDYCPAHSKHESTPNMAKGK